MEPVVAFSASASCRLKSAHSGHHTAPNHVTSTRSSAAAALEAMVRARRAVESIVLRIEIRKEKGVELMKEFSERYHPANGKASDKSARSIEDLEFAQAGAGVSPAGQGTLPNAELQ